MSKIDAAIYALRSFTLRNFIEERVSRRISMTRAQYCEALRFATSLRKVAVDVHGVRVDIAKLYASQLH